MRLGRVIVNMDYIVDLDDQAMVARAMRCLFNDLMQANEYDELSAWLTTIEDDNVTEGEIPEFLLDDCEDEEY